MTVKSGEDTGAAGGGDRVGAEAVVEHYTFVCQPADIAVISIICQNSAIDSPCQCGMVVAQDKKDIGPPAFILRVLLLVFFSGKLSTLNVCDCSGCRPAG